MAVANHLLFVPCYNVIGLTEDYYRYSPNGKLREENIRKCFLPFNAKEILEVILGEYYLETKGAVEIVFEGTKEEYNELARVAQETIFEGKIIISRSNQVLDNAKFILSDTKEVFLNYMKICWKKSYIMMKMTV